jgi:SulP family sulfate permease
VVLIPISAAHGANGVLVVGLLAGVVLLVLAFSGAGRAMRYIPVPVVEGFTAGIAAIIALQQVPALLGVDVHAPKVAVLALRAVQEWSRDPHWITLASGAWVVAAILLTHRIRPGLPAALPLIAVLSVANAKLGWGLATIGTIPAGLPLPHLPTIPWADLDALILPAIAVAALAALESLLSASVADAMSVGQRHNPDRELFGQGLANLASPLFGGIPATAAIARTAVNVRAGASSRLAALSHSAILLLIVLVASRWVGEIPVTALAGVLVATAFHMVRISSLGALMRATRGDAATLVATAAATVAFDLVQAVLIGLVVAGFFALRTTARSARLQEIRLDESDHGTEEHELLDQHIVAYRLDGPLFFGAAHAFLLELSEASKVRVVILRMSHLTAIDATGAYVLTDTIERLRRRGITVLLSGLQPKHARTLDQLGVRERIAHDRHFFATTPEAIAHARVHVARDDHHPHAARATPEDLADD